MGEDRALDLRSFVDWMEAGRREAAPLLDGFLEVTGPSSWDEWLAAHPDAGSVQFFEGVLEAAEHDPARTLALTDFLLRHAGSVSAPSGTEVALTMLLGNAWCARARALRDAGDADEAVRAYEMALAVFSAEPVLREELQETEREAAALRGRGMASRLLAKTPFHAWPSLAQRTEMQHPAALAELSRETAARLHRVPPESLAMAQLAVTIAGALSIDTLPPVALAQIQGRAWKDLGVALRHVARHDEALSALARAGEVLGNHPTNLAFDLATVHLARAATLQEVNRFDESIAEFAKCKPVFENYGDRRRLVFCGVFEGALLHRQHRYGEAIDVYRSLLADAEPRARREWSRSFTTTSGIPRRDWEPTISPSNI
jgi:tetratricopeptide (TPR) repeat protein